MILRQVSQEVRVTSSLVQRFPPPSARCVVYRQLAQAVQAVWQSISSIVRQASDAEAKSAVRVVRKDRYKADTTANERPSSSLARGSRWSRAFYPMCGSR